MSAVIAKILGISCVLLSNPAFADIEVKSASGDVKTISDQDLTKNCERFERDRDIEIDTRYENFNGTISFVNPRIRYAGRLLPIAQNSNTATGYCALQGLGVATTGEVVTIHSEQTQAASLAIAGTISNVFPTTPDLKVYRLITCKKK